MVILLLIQPAKPNGANLSYGVAYHIIEVAKQKWKMKSRALILTDMQFGRKTQQRRIKPPIIVETVFPQHISELFITKFLMLSHTWNDKGLL